MQSLVKNESLEILTKNIKSKFPEIKIWLYGSRARGDAHQFSDYDLFIIHSYPLKDSEAINDMIWEYGFDKEIFLSPVIISSKEKIFSKLNKIPLYKNILKEGILL